MFSAGILSEKREAFPSFDNYFIPTGECEYYFPPDRKKETQRDSDIFVRENLHFVLGECYNIHPALMLESG